MLEIEGKMADTFTKANWRIMEAEKLTHGDHGKAWSSVTLYYEDGSRIDLFGYRYEDDPDNPPFSMSTDDIRRVKLVLKFNVVERTRLKMMGLPFFSEELSLEIKKKEDGAFTGVIEEFGMQSMGKILSGEDVAGINLDNLSLDASKFILDKFLKLLVMKPMSTKD